MWTGFGGGHGCSVNDCKVSFDIPRAGGRVDASQVIGAPQVAGLIVVPKGFGASALRAASNDIGTGTANVVGASLSLMLGRSRRKGQQALGNLVFDTPRFGGYGFLALTEQELVLLTGPRLRCSPAYREAILCSPTGSAMASQPPTLS